MTEKAILVRDLMKVYGEGPTAYHALKRINFEVNRGELVMLLGPSGSGKTTLLSIMGCILQASSGSVQVCGQEVVGLSEKKLPAVRLKYIGFIFQAFNLFPALSAGENVELSLELKGVRSKEAKRKAIELLERVGLGGKHKSYPADLSGGQKQRVAIARAISGEPDIILADEPTASLDSTSGRTVMEMLREMSHERNRAVVVVTHDNRTFDYADRIVHIEDGQIRDVDPNVARLAQHENPGMESIWGKWGLGK